MEHHINTAYQTASSACPLYAARGDQKPLKDLEMEKKKKIQPSRNSWASPAEQVKKKDSSM